MGGSSFDKVTPTRARLSPEDWSLSHQHLGYETKDSVESLVLLAQTMLLGPPVRVCLCLGYETKTQRRVSRLLLAGAKDAFGFSI